MIFLMRSFRLFFLIVFFSFQFIVPAQSYRMRALSELINKAEPGWDKIVQPLIESATNKVEVLPCDKSKADSALYQAQVTTRSAMGAIVYETGGILVNNGWIRIIGSGSEKMNRSLMEWNLGKSFAKFGQQPTYLLIADDVLGGFFAINAGGIDSVNIGKVYYFSPDNLLWEPLGLSYTDFLRFCFTGDLKKFYSAFYWKNWEQDVKELNGDKAISCFPYLCTKEGEDINKVSRKAVPVQELWDLQMDLRKQLFQKRN